MGAVVAKGPAADQSAPGDTSLFGRRLARLEQVVILLRGLRRDYTQAQIAQIQKKAEIYTANMKVSHGERQGIASAETAQDTTEVLQLKGEIEVLEDERRFLEFCVTWTDDG